MLNDKGNLTDLRTAIAGRNAAEEMMAPQDVSGIGVLGTGIQARLQVQQLESLYPKCRDLTVWGRTPANVVAYADEMKKRDWHVTIAKKPADVAQSANLIVTTTMSKEALLDADDINSKTLIIAIGADAPGKVELSQALLKKASNIVVDSITHSKQHGNAAPALKSGVINLEKLQEFGSVVSDGLRAPENDSGPIVFLSSGVGVQDLQIVQAVVAGRDHVPDLKTHHTLFKQQLATIVTDNMRRGSTSFIQGALPPLATVTEAESSDQSSTVITAAQQEVGEVDKTSDSRSIAENTLSESGSSEVPEAEHAAKLGN